MSKVQIKWPWNDPKYLSKRLEVDLNKQRDYSSEEFIKDNKMGKDYQCNRKDGLCIHVGCEYERRCVYTEMGAANLKEPMQATEQPRIPEFIELLEQSKAIHLKKNKDYANENNPFSNFERSAELISWFKGSTDKAFVALIGTKLARIAELRDGRVPNNESLEDSFLDLLTYVGLWAAYVKRNKSQKL